MDSPPLSPWIIRPKPNEHALVRLFCFPYAGGDANAFRLWPNHLPPDIEVNALEFPGCLRRITEEPYNRMEPLIADLAPFLIPHLDRPFAFFGLCTGSFIALELIHRIRDLCGRIPLHFLPACIWSPHLPYGHAHLHGLPEDEFVKEFLKLGGMPREAMDEPELMNIVLVAARADFEVSETYAFTDRGPLNCPVTAIGANLDDIVDPEQIAAWSRIANGGFKSKFLDGDHCLWETSREALVRTVAEEIKGSLEAEREETFL